jgi:hypothetical protein
MKHLQVMILAGLFLFVPTAQAQWEPTQRLTWTPGSSEYPDIAVGSMGYSHVVWHDLTATSYEIYYKRSTDWGVTWSTSRRLTWTSTGSLEPVVAVDSSGNPQVFWREYLPGSMEIYHKRSTDGGATWSTNQRLTWNSGSPNCPSLPSAPRAIFIWLGLMIRPEIPKFITRKARTRAPLGRQAKGSPGTRATRRRRT